MSKEKSGLGGGLGRNEKGGIAISEEELKIAWDWFDSKSTGKLTAHDIKKRLSAFYKNVSVKEIRYLLNNQPEITFDELYNPCGTFIRHFIDSVDDCSM